MGRPEDCKLLFPSGSGRSVDRMTREIGTSPGRRQLVINPFSSIRRYRINSSLPSSLILIDIRRKIADMIEPEKDTSQVPNPALGMVM